jgi:hypothetical protein
MYINKYIKVIMKYIFIINLIGKEEEGAAISISVVESGGAGGDDAPLE